MKKKILATIYILLATFLFVVPLTTNALTTENETDPVIVVSLGDSYSSGEGIEPFYGQTGFVKTKVEDDDWLAHRSEKSWPALLKIPSIVGTMSDYRANSGSPNDIVEKLPECQWYFVASSGATTEHFSKEQRKDYNKLVPNENGNEGYYLKNYKDLPPQSDIFDKDKIEGDVDYVTLTIGGNDIGFLSIMTDCVFGVECLRFMNSDLDKRIEAIKSEWDTNDTNTSYKKRLRDTYLKIHDKAPNAKIIIAGYPHILDSKGKGALIHKNEATKVNEGIDFFDDKVIELIESLNEELGEEIYYFADVRDEFDGVSDGKQHAAYSGDENESGAWIHGLVLCNYQDLNDLGIISSYSFHPNKYGAQAYARCVNAVIEEASKKETSIFETMPRRFTFSSGHAWSTDIDVENDGSFTGQYHQSARGITGSKYPNGTEYICNFKGKFSQTKKLDKWTYSMKLDSLELENTPGDEHYENGVRYIYAEPCGLENADEFLIYLPGIFMDDLPTEFVSWSHLNPNTEITLPCYGIYNVNGKAGFVSHENENHTKLSGVVYSDVDKLPLSGVKIKGYNPTVASLLT